jgi:hypothetical protein
MKVCRRHQAQAACPTNDQRGVSLHPRFTYFFLWPTALLSACSAALTYDSLRDHASDACSRMVEPDRTACMKRISSDYETYRRQREELMRRRNG